MTQRTADVLVVENRYGNSEGILAAGKFKNGWCFVLSPEKKDTYGYASRQALRAYADAIKGQNPQLAADLRVKVDKIVQCMS